MFMEQHKENCSGQETTKTLKGVVDKIDRFNGQSIINF